MARSSSKRVIYAALIGNLLVAATKFAAAGFTGSAAMLSEAIHSTVDSGNQLLLLLGISRAARPANAKHPFGHGLQLYFWTFVVAVLIFGVGAGVSVLEGISKIGTPHPVENPWVNYVVLGLALLFEGAVWVMALRAFRSSKVGLGWLEAVQLSKDPTVFTVLFEDTAAILGLLVALFGLSLSEVLDAPVLDGVASFIIGLILAGTAAFLAWECQSLLTGEGASPEVQASLHGLRPSAGSPAADTAGHGARSHRGAGQRSLRPETRALGAPRPGAAHATTTRATCGPAAAQAEQNQIAGTSAFVNAGNADRRLSKK